MRPKLTWRVRRWSEGSWIEPLPKFRRLYGESAGEEVDFRGLYGESAAEVVEELRDMVKDHRDQPSAQDRKHTLRALSEAPDGIDLTRLDSLTFAMLTHHSLRMYRAQHIEALTPAQVSRCALAALDGMRSTPGKPRSDPLAELLVDRLLELLPATATPEDRDTLLTDALQVCGFGATPENLRRLLAKRGRFSNVTD